MAMPSPENLILEPLRHIRGAVEAIRDDMREVKERLGTLEANYASVSRRLEHLPLGLNHPSEKKRLKI
jgi:hypothetical protein